MDNVTPEVGFKVWASWVGSIDDPWYSVVYRSAAQKRAKRAFYFVIPSKVHIHTILPFTAIYAYLRTLEWVDVTNPPWSQLIFCFVPYFSHRVQKKALKRPATSSAVALKICYYDFPYVQGQLTEVPLNFEIFVIKVVGQTM